ncbi:MAG: hypothetical protein ABEJ40_02390 [Haloarculaceae archaeon]
MRRSTSLVLVGVAFCTAVAVVGAEPAASFDAAVAAARARTATLRTVDRAATSPLAVSAIGLAIGTGLGLLNGVILSAMYWGER